MTSQKKDHAKRIQETIGSPSLPSLDPTLQQNINYLRDLFKESDRSFLDTELQEALQQSCGNVDVAFEYLEKKDDWCTSRRKKQTPAAQGPAKTQPAKANQGRNRDSTRRPTGQARGADRAHPKPAGARGVSSGSHSAPASQPLDGVAVGGVASPPPAAFPPANPRAHITVEVHKSASEHPHAHSKPQGAAPAPRTQQTYASSVGAHSPAQQSQRAPPGNRGGNSRSSGSRGSGAPVSRQQPRHGESHAQPATPKISPYLEAARKGAQPKKPLVAPVEIVQPVLEPVPSEPVLAPVPVDTPAEPVPQAQVEPQPDVIPEESVYQHETHTPAPAAPEPISTPQQPSGQFDLPLFTSTDAFQENPGIRFGSFQTSAPQETPTPASHPDAPSEHAQAAPTLATQQPSHAQPTFSSQPTPAQSTTSTPQSGARPSSNHSAVQHADDKLSNRHAPPPSPFGIPMPHEFHPPAFHHYMPPAFPPVFPPYEHPSELMGIPPGHPMASPPAHSLPEPTKSGQPGHRIASPNGAPQQTASPDHTAPGSQPYHYNTPPYYYSAYGIPYFPHPQSTPPFNPPYRAPGAGMPYFKPPYAGNFPPAPTGHSPYTPEDLIQPEYMYPQPPYYLPEIPPIRATGQPTSQTKSADGTTDMTQGQGASNTSYYPWPSYPNP